MSGLFGGGDSSSSNSTTTTNTDKRMSLSNGVGVSSDSSTVTVNTLDAGIVNAALQVVAASDAAAAGSFEKVLTLADKMFTSGFKALASSQELTQQAYSNATNDKAGALDNRTIAILGVAGALAWAWAKHH